MEPKTDLKGRVAVVLGGASGIGLALASRAAEQGMKVALADAEECLLAAALEQVKAKDAGAITVRTDIADADAVRTLARRIEAELGPPWLVCNNSGLRQLGPDWELTPAHLKWSIGVNLWGVINGVQVFTPGMVERDAGHIVNIASADLFGAPGAAPYVATTHAIVGLSESLYRELDAVGSQVGVTVVCPALVNTSVTSATRDRPAARKAGHAIDCGPPLGREIRPNILPPEEVAEQILAAVTTRRFWISPHASPMPELSSCRSDTALGIRRKGLTSTTSSGPYAQKHNGFGTARPVIY
jgi:NAD(P)-dependent dehydrogenase (short-subunit alcohol dehydrogenase family)